MTIRDEIVDKYGTEVWDLVLTVYLNFYYSELKIIDLCGSWLKKRGILREKGFLIYQASDELTHAKLFREGVERLGVGWDDIDHSKYRIADIDNRFDKLFATDDELEVLIGLNLYAEGVLAMEELSQLAKHKPEYFFQFARIERDERRHVAFGLSVAKRVLEEHPELRAQAVLHCLWYREHLRGYLNGELANSISRAREAGFVGADYVQRTQARFDSAVKDLGLELEMGQHA